MSITVVMNGFRRPHTLREQYEAIKRQTFKDFEIILWINIVDKTNITFDQDILDACQTITSNTDYGSWGRFVASLNARTKYICVIDDDTIPGSKWLDNCMNTMNENFGVLSTRGVLMNKGYDDRYPLPESYKAIGWCNPNEITTRVDMGCHSWFFDKAILRAFFAEMPYIFPQRFGEDTHISYAAKKHYNANTYVPPHPANDIEMWGSMPETAIRYGEEPVAISLDRNANLGMNQYWNAVRRAGYPIISEELEQGQEQNEIHNSTN